MEWMAWTLPTMIFFIVIASILALMTLWQIVSPTVERKGFLPMRTTRGDRLFIALLSAAYLHLAWLATTDLSLWWALGLSVIVLVVLLRWG